MNKEQKKTFMIIIFSLSIFLLILSFGSLLINFQNIVFIKNNSIDSSAYEMLSYIEYTSLAFLILIIFSLLGHGFQIFKQNNIINLTTLGFDVIIFIYSFISFFYVTSYAKKTPYKGIDIENLATASSYQVILIQILISSLLIILSYLYLFFKNRNEEDK